MRTARALAALLLLAAWAAAQPGVVYVTEFGRRVLSRTDQIIEGRVLRVSPPFRGIASARIEVTRVLSGYDRSREILLLYTDDFSAPDALGARYERIDVATKARPGGSSAGAALEPTKREDQSAGRSKEGAGVRFEGGDIGIFFLSRRGSTYGLFAALSRTDPFFEAKKARLEATLALEAEPLIDEKAANARDFHIAGLEAPGLWERGNSARELESLARRFPKLFREEDYRAVERKAAEEADALLRTTLERTLLTIDPVKAAPIAAEAEERARARMKEELDRERTRLKALRDESLRASETVQVARRYGAAATDVVCGMLADDSAIVREAAARAVEFGAGPSAAEPLAAALRRERDADARRAIIEACGALPSAPAVPVLASLLRERTEEQAVVEALARIPGDESLRVLEAHGKAAGAETRRWIDALLREQGRAGS